MNLYFIIILTLFLHVVADYNLQGWLATAKTKEYWRKNAPRRLYRFDYICALLMHSISWTFVVMIPVAYIQSFNVDIPFITVFVVNILVHMIVDDQKANKLSINLWVDQIIHIIQLIATILILY